jgi:hypothetical protein
MELTSLKAQVAQLLEKLNTPAAPAGTQGQQPQTGAVPPGQGSDSRPDPSSYSLSIPDQLTTMLFGEDAGQSKMALEHIINASLSIVHQRVREDFRTELATVQAARSQTEAAQATEVATTQAREQYFTAFPQHNNATVMPLLAQESAALAAQFPNHPWDANFVNALGARVNAKLLELQTQLGGVAPAAPSPALVPAAAPAAFTPMAPRAAVPTAQTEQDTMLDTFSFS